jgi:Prealbumin-like fold domain
VVRVSNVRAILLLLAMSTIFAPTHIPAEPQTGIEGVITIAPAAPGPVRVDAPASVPLANATWLVKNDKGAMAKEFTTDDQGRFQTSLPAGRYIVSLKGKKTGVGHFGPFEVDVVAGQITKVQWQCDSGIR